MSISFGFINLWSKCAMSKFQVSFLLLHSIPIFVFFVKFIPYLFSSYLASFSHTALSCCLIFLWLVLNFLHIFLSLKNYWLERTVFKFILHFNLLKFHQFWSFHSFPCQSFKKLISRSKGLVHLLFLFNFLFLKLLFSFFLWIL